jgi:hypothetical protein
VAQRAHASPVTGMVRSRHTRGSGRARYTESVADDTVKTALAAARLRAIRLALLSLHKELIDAERVRYERAHGRIRSRHEALRLLLQDSWFAWLRPLAALIVEIDERLDAGDPIDADGVQAFTRQVRALLTAEASGDGFRREYHRMLQDVPAVVVAHGRVATLLSEGSRPRA